MTIARPFYRTCRPFLDGSYAGNGNWRYAEDPRFAEATTHYIRSFLLLVKDLQELFDYVEPADKNLGCYSYRIHALLLRACVEVEANCKAILSENGYARSDDLNMGDYKKIETTHRLSSFKAVIPHWTGVQHTRTPFAGWKSGGGLPWYQAYNASKHDRHMQFSQATFEQLLDACCGLLVLLSAQFHTNDFSGEVRWEGEPPQDGSQTAIGQFLRVRFPDDWPMEDRYDFDWDNLKTEPDAFQKIDYTKV